MKKILILGLGVTGQSALKYFHSLGYKITVVDGKDRNEFDADFINEYEEDGVVFKFKTHKLESYDFDLLITSPGVKPNNEIIVDAIKNGVEVKNDVTYFIEQWNGIGPIVGVTGSNGKSTIVSFIQEILKSIGRNSILVGNIGVSPLDYLSSKIPDGTVAVMELSSYQLENFDEKHGVDIAIISNLTSNHLDRYHGKMSEYAEAKLKIGSKNKTKLILNLDDEGTQKYIMGNAKNHSKEIWGVSLKTSYQEANINGIYTNEKSDLILVNDEETDIAFGDVNKRELIGLHNLYNIATILPVLNLLGIEIDEKVEDVIRAYKGLEHRIEKVLEIDGVLYVNDSKSTTPDATRVAIEALARDRNIVLIAGGENKGMDFSAIVPLLSENVKAIILLPGDAGELLEKQIREQDTELEIIWSIDMQDAVLRAREKAVSGDIVLLSPSASSLNTYKNFEHRGEIFKMEVRKLIV